jgi:hypothetical protein
MQRANVRVKEESGGNVAGFRGLTTLLLLFEFLLPFWEKGDTMVWADQISLREQTTF